MIGCAAGSDGRRARAGGQGQAGKAGDSGFGEWISVALRDRMYPERC